MVEDVDSYKHGKDTYSMKAKYYSTSYLAFVIDITLSLVLFSEGEAAGSENENNLTTVIVFSVISGFLCLCIVLCFVFRRRPVSGM